MKIKCYCGRSLALINKDDDEHSIRWANHDWECPEGHVAIVFDNKQNIIKYIVFIDINHIRYKIIGANNTTKIYSKNIEMQKNYILELFIPLKMFDFMMPLPFSENGELKINDNFIDKIYKLVVFS